MNILYITSVFPRPQEGATIYTDLAEALTASGHQLTVVVADEHKSRHAASLSWERNIRVLRVRTGRLYNVNLITKGISTLTLHRYMQKAIYHNLRTKSFDLILFETPPISICKTVAYTKKLFGAPTFLMLKDIFPQNGVDLGLYSARSPIYRYFRSQEKKLYQVADIIGCMSPANMTYIKKHNTIPDKKVVLFPNTKAESPIPSSSPSEIRKAFSLPEDKVIFLFGGNIGIPQAPDHIINCAKAICREENAFFLVVGRGTHGAYVEEAMQDVPNFRLMENLPRDQYETLQSACDVGLIFLDKRFTIPNFPSRILSYMNSGLPVIASTDDVSDIKELITDAKCGFWCSSGSSEDFSQIAHQLLQDASLRHSLGENGQQYFKKHLTVQKSIALLTQYLQKEEHE